MRDLVRAATQKALGRLDQRRRGVLLTVAGGATLLGGGKLTALALVDSGLRDLEAAWRERHPEFTGGLRERWQRATEFYEATHKDPTNRKLHIVGIPIIVSGTLGMLVWPRFTPPWVLSAAGFTFGWGLNIVGHALYEKNAPAFADDPLSFLAGPIWDLKNFREIVAGGADVQVAA